jgi:hypothetical protein
VSAELTGEPGEGLILDVGEVEHEGVIEEAHGGRGEEGVLQGEVSRIAEAEVG